TATANDNVDGPTPVSYYLDSGLTRPVSSGATFPLGTTTVYAAAIDQTGNRATSSFTVRGEGTAPPLTGSRIAGRQGAHAWYLGRVTVTLSAADTASGVASTSYSVDGGTAQTYSGPFTVNGDGTHRITFFSTDRAGNTEASQSVSINI